MMTYFEIISISRVSYTNSIQIQEISLIQGRLQRLPTNSYEGSNKRLSTREFLVLFIKIFSFLTLVNQIF